MRLRANWTAALCLVLGGCGGGGATAGTGGAGGQASNVFSVSTDDSVRVRQGETVDVEVQIQRLDVEGEIEISLEGLPTQSATEPIVIPGTSSSGTLTIETVLTTPQGGPMPMTITATSSDDPSRTASTTTELYVAGKAGTPDVSFSFDGVATYAVMPGPATFEAPRGVAADRRGRVLVSGSSQPGGGDWVGWVLRFANDGEIDETFGDAGEIHGFGPGASSVEDVTIRADDGVLVSAFFNDFPNTASYLRAFDANGELDPEYGTGGDVVFEGLESYGIVERETDVVVHSSQTMVAFDLLGAPVSGFSFASIPINEGAILTAVADREDRVLFSFLTADWTIRRTRADGTLDNEFAEVGWLTVDPPDTHTRARVTEIALRPNGGGVAMASSSVDSMSNDRVVLIRFDATGVLDPGFGSAGILEVVPEDMDGSGWFVHVQPDEGIVAVLGVNGGSGPHQVKRFHADGSPDTSFGTNGVTMVPDTPEAVGWDAAGDRLILAGRDYDASAMVGSVVITRIWL